MGANRDAEVNRPMHGLPAIVIFNQINTLVGCSKPTKNPIKKLFIFKVGDEKQRTVDEWVFRDHVKKCKLSGQNMGDACTTTEAAILQAAEFMAYNIVRDLKEYFAIFAHSRNHADSIEIVIDTNPRTDIKISIEMQRIMKIIPKKINKFEWFMTRNRIIDMCTTTLILSTRSTMSNYIPLVGAEFSGDYFINPFTWYASSIPETKTMTYSEERARIALSPIALILHESDHDKNCIFTDDNNACNKHTGPGNFIAEDATIIDIDKGLGAHPDIAKRFAYIGGFSENDCTFPMREEEINNGIRVFLDRPLPSHETPTGLHYMPYSQPASTTRPSGLVCIEFPSDSTLRSGIKSKGPYRKP